MLGSLSAEEWREWQVFARTEPIGALRSDFQAALIAHTVAQTIPRRRGTSGPKLATFVADFWGERKASEEQAPNQMLLLAASVTKAMGGTIAPTVDEALRNDASREAPSGIGAR